MNIGSYDDSDDSDDDESPREKNQVTSSGLTDFCVRNIKEKVAKCPKYHETNFYARNRSNINPNFCPMIFLITVRC